MKIHFKSTESRGIGRREIKRERKTRRVREKKTGRQKKNSAPSQRTLEPIMGPPNPRIIPWEGKTRNEKRRPTKSKSVDGSLRPKKGGPQIDARGGVWDLTRRVKCIAANTEFGT